MIQMVSLRTFRLATTRGHVLFFKAKQPLDVPEDVAAEAMAKGCVPTNDADVPFIDDLTRSRVEFQGDIRRSVLLLTVQALAKENNVSKFTGGGVPKAKVISEQLGFDVPAGEVQAVWQEFLTAKSQGADLVLHPSANDVLAIIEAEDRSDLDKLAVKFNIPADRFSGLSTREARRLLLTKFHGLSTG